MLEKPVEIRMQHAKGTIDSSLFLAARDAGVTDTLIMNLAGIFAWDIDFVLDIRQGDSFTMVFEEIWQDGAFVRNGEILAAEFNNDGDTFRAVRYADPDGETGYFTPEGLNVKKAFLRAPIAFTPRVTSNFNPNRKHPVLKSVRPHRGVDYGAPRGTPIKAAGDGKVIFRGRKNGYGNTVILQHGGNITTLYAHMSKFSSKAKSGSRVKQGQVVGYVGATGTATGNHLHYEYRLNGVHRNPRTVKLPQALPVPTKYKADFMASTRPLINHLDAVSKTQRLASIQ
jgi:murein DD-endopeptidase MepM/ murein hydrolase activator NlpD